jgi:thiamine-phosphate pyrophosphorylase
MAGMGGSHDGCRVYLITPPTLDPLLPFADRLAAALDAGDAAAVQLRLKDVGDDTWRRAIDALRPVTQSRGVALLLKR